MPIIKLKRGLKANLPATADPGEPHYTTDTNELYVANLANNVIPVKTKSSNIIDKGAANGVAELDDVANVIHNIKTDNLYFHAAGQITIDYNENILLESLSIAEFRVANWLINVADQQTGKFYTCQISAHHDGISADFTLYGEIGIETVGFTVVVENTKFRLYGLSTKNSQVVRFITTAIRFT